MTRTRTTLTLHRRRPYHVVLISRALTSPPSPLAGWLEDWSWIDTITPAEAVCKQIAAAFDEVPPVRQPVLPGLDLRRYGRAG